MRMKFEISDICPFSKAFVKRKQILVALPVVVSVKRETRPDSAKWPCDGTKYRLRKMAANWLREDAGLPPVDRDCTVCEHMGKIVR